MDRARYNFKKLASQLNALDNETKLQILALLTEEGAKSITDISRSLKINFSTAHKYLEQLERAGVVKSKQETTSRLKRMFSIQDFQINVSPESLTRKSFLRTNDERALNILTDWGEQSTFDRKKFLAPYLEEGIPLDVLNIAIDYLLKRTYEGVTLSEIKYEFDNLLRERVQSLAKSMNNLNRKELQERTITSALRLMHPDALERHRSGNIFITNLRQPKLLNFVHDIRGISIHGVKGKKSKTSSELFTQILYMVKIVNKLAYPVQAFDSFNYFIAPLLITHSEEAIRTELKKFLIALNKTGISSHIALEIGAPNFIKEVPPEYLEYKYRKKYTNSYELYADIASKIAKHIVNFKSELPLDNIGITLKFHEEITDKHKPLLIPGVFIANMTQPWQTTNASFIGSSARFDSNWKGWMRSTRIGEIQNIAINLPRLAMQSEYEGKFFENLEELVGSIINYHYCAAEATTGEFLRNYRLSFDSVLNRKWGYIQLDDSVFSISIVGMKECVDILNGVWSTELADRIIKFINRLISVRKSQIRIDLKSEKNELIAKRFCYLDNREFKTNISSYSTEIPAEFHRLLRGGHGIEIKPSQIKDLPKSFGMVKLK